MSRGNTRCHTPAGLRTSDTSALPPAVAEVCTSRTARANITQRSALRQTTPHHLSGLTSIHRTARSCVPRHRMSPATSHHSWLITVHDKQPTRPCPFAAAQNPHVSSNATTSCRKKSHSHPSRLATHLGAASESRNNYCTASNLWRQNASPR
mgnify:CR=1 FL=1